MNITKRDILCCEPSADGMTLLKVLDERGQLKRFDTADMLHVDIPFSHAHALVLCEVIAKCSGLKLKIASRGFSGSLQCWTV